MMNIVIPKDKDLFSTTVKRYKELHEQLEGEGSPEKRQKLIDEIVSISKKLESGVE